MSALQLLRTARAIRAPVARAMCTASDDKVLKATNLKPASAKVKTSYGVQSKAEIADATQFGEKPAGKDYYEKSKWDTTSQTFHGGQDWADCDNFIEDFSVTTNPFGAPKKALQAAIDAVGTIEHYPAADFEPAITDLAQFLFGENYHRDKKRLLMGNGASELIDLVVRDGGKAGFFAPGDDSTQYKEYERSANAAGYVTVPPADERSTLTCIVNPCNPTGKYMHIKELKDYISNHVPDGSHVIVDESMQPWVGPHWREDSLLSQREWIRWMESERNVSVFLMHSWTKIWSCTGVRLGSVIAPSPEALQRIKQKQVPWSVNSMALAFTSEVVKDTEYLETTWKDTPVWRQHTCDEILKKFPSFDIKGEPYLSWVWVDCKSVQIADELVAVSKAAGVPVRSGSPGYHLPTMIRVAVRRPEHLEILLKSWDPVVDWAKAEGIVE